jgi:lysophospholipase L1-like esterase
MAATTANPGAYLRTLFSGNSCALLFDVAAMVAPASQLWWRIDNGPWTQASVAASVTCAVPAATAANSDVPYHLLEVVVKAMTETQNRWNAGASTRVVFAGLALDLNATVAAPGEATQRILVLGDSITEGVRTLGESAALDVDRNDALMGWALRLGALLGVEAGVVGFGAVGLTVGGAGNVPALPTSWTSLYAGVSRILSPLPSLVVINIGANDGSSNTVSVMVSMLNAILAACPGVPVAVMRPFNGAQAANLQAALAASSAPGMCHWIDTTGFLDTGFGCDGLALHPSGPNNMGRIAPAVAAALRPLIADSSSPRFRGGFLHTLVG